MMLSDPIARVAMPALGVDMGRGIALMVSYMICDFARMLGVTCGALIYLTRSREHSTWRRVIYFVVSLVGGNFLSQDVLFGWPQIGPWLAGFVSSAMLVTVAMLVLDWSEQHVVPTLDRLYSWIIKRLFR
jgi:hypothetical protein